MTLGASIGEAATGARIKRAAGVCPSPGASAELPTRRGLSGFGLGAAALAALAIASALPLQFTASTDVAFNVTTQPPAGAARGIAQVLGSRETARDALDRLAPRDIARLASGSIFPAADDNRASLTEQAARRIAQAVNITPIDGGRTLRISIPAPSPDLAARTADAYAAAALDLENHLDADAAQILPGFAHRLPTQVRMLPNLPGALTFTLFAAAIATLLLGRRRQSRESPRAGLLDPAELPRELTTPQRITWLDGHGQRGLDAEAAVAHLLPLATVAGAASPGRLILLTSDGQPEAARRCAATLARRLADEASVVLVLLDRLDTNADLIGLGCEADAPGIRELLLGRARFGETLHRDPRSRAHVIPPGRLPPGWTNAAGQDPAAASTMPLAAVLNALCDSYAYVVVANPPLVSAEPDLTALDPLVVCLTADTAPATAAVESFDLLAALQVSRIVLLRYAAPPAANSAQDMAMPSQREDARGPALAIPLKGAA